MKELKIYLLQQDYQGYDTYDSMVVISDSEENAKKESINEYGYWIEDLSFSISEIGLASLGQKEGVLVASFNAG